MFRRIDHLSNTLVGPQWHFVWHTVAHSGHTVALGGTHSGTHWTYSGTQWTCSGTQCDIHSDMALCNVDYKRMCCSTVECEKVWHCSGDTGILTLTICPFCPAADHSIFQSFPPTSLQFLTLTMVMKRVIPPDPIHQAHIPHQTPPPHHSHWEEIKFTGSMPAFGEIWCDPAAPREVWARWHLTTEASCRRMLGGIRRHSWMVAGLINWAISDLPPPLTRRKWLVRRVSKWKILRGDLN